MRVYDEDSKIVGSIDALFKTKSDKYIMIDWKTNKEIKKHNPFEQGLHPVLKKYPNCNYIHYSLQLNLYKYILEKNYGIKIFRMALVHFNENNSNYKIHVIPDMQHDIINILENRKD